MYVPEHLQSQIDLMLANCPFSVDLYLDGYMNKNIDVEVYGKHQFISQLKADFENRLVPDYNPWVATSKEATLDLIAKQWNYDIEHVLELGQDPLTHCELFSEAIYTAFDHLVENIESVTREWLEPHIC